MYYVIRKIAEEPYGIIAGPFETITQTELTIDLLLANNRMAGTYFAVLYLPQITR